MEVEARTLQPPTEHFQEGSLAESTPLRLEYAHSDGTVYHAENTESARAACPVLGKMAIEQADLLLEVAALGQLKMKEDAEKEQPKQPESKKTESDYTSKKATEVEPLKSKLKEATEVVRIEQILKQKVLDDQREPDQERQMQKAEKPKDFKTQAQPTISVSGETGCRRYFIDQDEPVHTKAEQIKTPNTQADYSVAKKPAAELSVIEEVAMLKQDSTAADALGDNNSDIKIEPNRVYEETEEDAPPSISKVDEDIETIDATSKLTKAELTTEEEIHLDLEIKFEPEVVEVYEDLLVLCEEVSEDMAETDGTNYEPVKMMALQTDTHYNFEVSIAIQQIAEETLPLETIVGQKDERPLEQTITQIVEYLSNEHPVKKPSENETSRAAYTGLLDDKIRLELHETLQEVIDVLPACYVLDEETLEQCTRITLEMTQKLLLLLGMLGYEYPEEVLTDFIRLHGLAFLLQAVHYMYQLSSTNFRQTLSPTVVSSMSSDDDTNSYSLTLGKSVLMCIQPSGFGIGSVT